MYSQLTNNITSDDSDDPLTVIDDALSEYYIALERDDYYSNEIGKFAQFCDDNGLDATVIKEELKCDVDECILVDFDRNFPFHDSVHIENENDRLTKILEILKYCNQYHKSPINIHQNVNKMKKGISTGSNTKHHGQINNEQNSSYYQSPINNNQNINYNNGHKKTFKVSNTNKMSNSNKQKPFIDFDVFKQNETKCNGYSDCSYLLRIINSLKYFESLSSIFSSDGKKVFFLFIIDGYIMCLDDYIHFICFHLKDVNKIKNMMNTTCSDINQCQFTRRHYRRRTENGVDDDDNDKYNFYAEIFDTIHFCLFHIAELGLNAIPLQINENEHDFSHQQIVKVPKEMEIKRLFKNKLNDWDLKRYNEANKKFNLNIDNDSNEIVHWEENTFMDDMFSDIQWALRNDANCSTINKLAKFIKSEEYDTDCIIQDIDMLGDDCNDNQTCNILQITNNIKYVKHIKQTKKDKDFFSCSFSIGFCFWYHPFYKNINADKQIKQETGWMDNNFGGYPISDLFVSWHYSSMKEEVLESHWLGLRQWKEKVVLKAQQYLQTDKCKNIKCIHCNPQDPLHYDIPFDAPLKLYHLYAVILYCDWTDFCTSFSSTFRRKSWNESILAVKKRNSKYHHVAKNLRELVQYYGNTGAGTKYDETKKKWINKENGPFYSGFNVYLNIPKFSIRLNCPVSVSKDVEIAIKFGTNDGIILQLNNTKSSGKYEVFFDSSWISNYGEENERIFFGGRFEIEVESIIIIETAENYQTLLSVYHKFDSILSGQRIQEHITQKDVDIIGMSIEHILGTSNAIDNITDKYIQNNFYLFTRNKTQIILHLPFISKIKNKLFIDLIMHPVQNQKKAQNNNNNLFKPVIFSLFPNLRQITIYTTYGDVYSFNILSLLSILTGISLPKSFGTIIIKDQYPSHSGKWLNKVFSSTVEDAFNSKKFNIDLETNQSTNHDEDWMTITVR